MSDAIEQALVNVQKLYAAAQPPEPIMPPTVDRGLLERVWGTHPSELEPDDLCRIIDWIGLLATDDVDALRFYLPWIVRAYWDGSLWCVDALEVLLLRFYTHFSADERRLLGHIAALRWRRHLPGTLFVTVACFLLFFLDDYSQLREVFEQAARPRPEADTYSTGAWHLELLAACKQQVVNAASPVDVIWEELINSHHKALRDRMMPIKGAAIQAFLQEVGWLTQQ